MLTRLLTILIFGLAMPLLAQEERPNVLLILCDDLVDLESPILLNNNIHTPHLDSLRAAGIDFSNAVSNSPICAPSRASLLTGVYPHTSGYHGYNMENDPVKENTVLSNSTDMFRAFKEAGYQVYGYGKLYHGDVFPDPDTKLLLDELVESERGPWAVEDSVRKGHSSYPLSLQYEEQFSAFPLSEVPSYGDSSWYHSDFSHFHYLSESDRDSLGDEIMTNLAVQRLEDLATLDTSFFMAMGYRRPHTPYYVPDEFYELYELDSIDISHVDMEDMGDVSLSQIYNRSYGISGFKTFQECLEAGSGAAAIGTAAELDSTYWVKQYIRGYFASVSFIDHEIGRLLDGLKENGLDSNTYVFLTSDHGIHLGDKLSFHKNTLWSSSLQVPLIVSGSEIPAGEIESMPVSLVDLFPTMTELCGLDSLLIQTQLEGHTLMPLMDTLPATLWEGPDFTVSSAASNEIITSSDHADKTHQNYALSVGDFRYIMSSSGEEELYLNFDPLDHLNLSSVPELSYHKDMLREKLCSFVGLENQEQVEQYLFYGDFTQKLNGWTVDDKADTALFTVMDMDSLAYLKYENSIAKEDVNLRNQHVRLSPFLTEYSLSFQARADSGIIGDAFKIKLEYVEKSFATSSACEGHEEVMVRSFELSENWYTYSVSFSFDESERCDGEYRFTLQPFADSFDIRDIRICPLEDNCDADCSEFLTPPVELTKNTDAIDGVADRVRLKWYKGEGAERYSIADSAACDVEFWPLKDLSTGYKYVDPEVSLMSHKQVRKPHKELYKWPVRFSRSDIFPNHRYRWRVRCYCKLGKGIASPWSATKYFNTPPFDPVTGLYYPGGEKSLSSLEESSVELIPNPAQGNVEISWTGKDVARVRVMDLTGRELILESVFGSERLSLDIAALSPGLYVVEVHGSGAPATGYLFVK